MPCRAMLGAGGAGGQLVLVGAWRAVFAAAQPSHHVLDEEVIFAAGDGVDDEVGQGGREIQVADVVLGVGDALGAPVDGGGHFIGAVVG